VLAAAVARRPLDPLLGLGWVEDDLGG